MTAPPSSTSYPPPPASQPAIESASGGRPWITLRPTLANRPKNPFYDWPNT